MATTAKKPSPAAKSLFDAWSHRGCIKAQIHAGAEQGRRRENRKGRSKKGPLAEKMMGLTLLTQPDGPEGRVVRACSIENRCRSNKALYLSSW